MPNYKLKYGVSEIARILQIDRNTIKTWAHHFKAYLSKSSNPQKAKARFFTPDDISVLAYISMYWEEEPDFENIRIGLNREEFKDYPFSDIKKEAIPIFQELSENSSLKNTVLIGGMFDIENMFALADAYKYSGDLLVGIALKNSEENELLFPIMYNYRHATELYLKAIIPNYNHNHKLEEHYNKFKELINKEFNQTPPKWFEDLINAFNDFDPNSTTFRYGTNLPKDEILIDLPHLKEIITLSAEAFQSIKEGLK